MMNSLYSINKANVVPIGRQLLADEENALFESAMPMNTASTESSPVIAPSPDQEIEQYLFAILKTEKFSPNHAFDGEDSGFVTSSSTMASPVSSPGSSPIISPNMRGHIFDSQNSGNNLTFHNIGNNTAQWSVDQLTNSLDQDKIRVFSNYSCRSSVENIELKVVKQPEDHHRARYMTEGSRGAIKDETGRGYPIVQLVGFNKTPVKLQCFIGHDQRIGDPHLFYQACEVSGKTQYTFNRIDGVNIIEMELHPRNQMQVVIDCIGILKERNVDVERKVLRSRKRSRRSPDTSLEETSRMMRNSSKVRSTHCRMVFRCLIPHTNEILQTVSMPILCTQPLGTPEIYKMSLREADMRGGQDLFVIGKNFHKDARVVFERTSTSGHWKRVVEPQKEFLNSTHLVCQVPRYDATDAGAPIVFANVYVQCSNKSSDPFKFAFVNSRVPSLNNHLRVAQESFGYHQLSFSASSSHHVDH